MRYQVYKMDIAEVVLDTQTTEVIAKFYKPDLAQAYANTLNEVEATDNRPLHWKTGIKRVNNVELYQTHCKCPNCRNTQTKYLSRWVKTTPCSECSFDLSVTIATDEFGKRDDYGNFFVAYKLG